MSKTPYSSDNQDFSNNAHILARKVLYPLLYGVPKENIRHLKAEGPINFFLDSRMGIDRSMRVKYDECPFVSYLFTVQERFREPHYQELQDVTITLWNNENDQPGELSKLGCHLFMYGFYDEERNAFTEAIVLRVYKLIEALASGELTIGETHDNPRSNQTFVCFKIRDLKRLGIVRLHVKEINGRLVCQSTEDHNG